MCTLSRPAAVSPRLRSGQVDHGTGVSKRRTSASEPGRSSMLKARRNLVSISDCSLDILDHACLRRRSP